MENFLTIDYEDWYQGLTSTATRPETWQTLETRLFEPTQWLLTILAQHSVKATFFVLGEVARELPELVRSIADAGHEIGIHSDKHQRIDHMSPEIFRTDLAAAIEAVSRSAGVKPLGYRAPYFSVNTHMQWFWEELAHQELVFDSSLFPIHSPLYGDPEAPRHPFRVDLPSGRAIAEIPMTTFRKIGINLPFSGGFYFRLLPYTIIRKLTKTINSRGEPVIFYFHPWEFDPTHPLAPTTTAREKISHYSFLNGNRENFGRLLSDFNFQPLSCAKIVKSCTS